MCSRRNLTIENLCSVRINTIETELQMPRTDEARAVLDAIQGGATSRNPEGAVARRRTFNFC